MSQAVGLRIRFPLGRYHATPWGAHVNEAGVEWPPSPWRVLRAIYSVGRTNVELAALRGELDDALGALIAAGPPRYVLPPSIPSHTRHFVKSRRWSGHAPGETDMLLDGFLAVAPDAPLEVWWRAELEAPARRALSMAAAALGYLGRSESVCEAELLGDREAPLTFSVVEADAQVAATGGARTTLLCPDAEAPVEVLGTGVDEVRRERRRLPLGTRRREFVVHLPAEPAVATALDREALPTLARFRVVGAARPRMVDAVEVTAKLRAAVQSSFDPTTQGRRSSTLSGHDEDGVRRADDHAHAHWLAASEDAHDRIDHLLVWAPEGLQAGEVTALAAVTRLTGRPDGGGVLPPETRIAMVGLGPASTTAETRLVGPSTAWTSLTPFALPRHVKQRGGRIVDGPREQVERELHHRGLPGLVSLERLRSDGWHAWRSRRRPSDSHRTLVGLRLELEEPVEGPLALGALSHFGLGLFVVARG